MDRIAAEHGTVDILVNNAGNHCKKYIWDMSVEEYKSVLDVHLTGAFALTKAVVPYMKEKRHGRIIFQASMTSYIGQPMVAGYASAKAGYLGLIHTLTAELAEYGITANAIAPGWIDTPMFHKATDGDPQRLGKILGRIPAKMVGDPMDIGMVTAFLCSDAARYISGSCIPVDGGALIGITDLVKNFSLRIKRAVCYITNMRRTCRLLIIIAIFSLWKSQKIRNLKILEKCG